MVLCAFYNNQRGDEQSKMLLLGLFYTKKLHRFSDEVLCCDGHHQANFSVCVVEFRNG